ATGAGDAEVQRRRLPGPGRPPQVAHASERRHDRRRPVGRRVVDHANLRRGARLPENAAQRVAHEPLAVEDGHDRADRRASTHGPARRRRSSDLLIAPRYPLPTASRPWVMLAPWRRYRTVTSGMRP